MPCSSHVAWASLNPTVTRFPHMFSGYNNDAFFTRLGGGSSSELQSQDRV